MKREDEDYPNGCAMAMALSLPLAMLLLLFLTLLCGCTKTVFIPVESHHYHTDSVRVAVERIDTFIRHDSTYVERKGDTLLVVKYQNVYKNKIVHDTVEKESVKLDSIGVPYPVEKPLTKWQQAKQDVGGFAMGGCVGLLAIAIVWLVRRFKR